MAIPTYATSLVDAAGGAMRLTQLLDQDGDGTDDTGLSDRVLCEAEGIVNSYVRKVHNVPLIAPIPQTIATMTADIAIFLLKGRRDALTEGDLARHEERIRWLEGIAKGRVDLGATPTTSASPHNVASSTARPSSKAVSRENLKGFA